MSKLRLVFSVVGVLFFSLSPHPAQAMAEKDTGNLGEIRQSILSVDDFRKIYGDGWVPMDGRLLNDDDDLKREGLWSREHIPNANGRFLRSHSYDSGCNPEAREVGDSQEDSFASHDHGGGDHDHPPIHPHTGFTCNINGSHNLQTGTGSCNMLAPATGRSGNMIKAEGGSETRPKCIIVNTFIKINRTRENQATQTILKEIANIPGRVLDSPQFKQLQNRLTKAIHQLAGASDSTAGSQSLPR